MGYLDAHVSPRTDLREGSRMAEPIVYIDRSRVGPGKLEQLKDGIRRLVEFVERREPRLISYGFFLDEEQLRMTVIAIHPDSASLELHMEIAGPEFRKLRELVELTEIEVYGRPSERALVQLQEKARMLGTGGQVTVLASDAGFARVNG
jgi:quinol monooxygenase YgiN